MSDLLTGRVSGVQVVIPSGSRGPRQRCASGNLPASARRTTRCSWSRCSCRQYDDTGGRNQAGFGQSGGRFNDINPNDIESIEIVKGPSAATLYGTDAANGVLVIKTKRGATGATRWRAFGEYGQSTPAPRSSTTITRGESRPPARCAQCTLLAVPVSGACTIDSLTRFNPLTHPQTSPLGTGSRNQVGLQVSGGVGTITYLLSGSHDDEMGLERMPSLEIARLTAERGGAAVPDEQIRPNYANNLRLRGNFSTPMGGRDQFVGRHGIGYGDKRTAFRPGACISTASSERNIRDAADGWNMGVRPGEQWPCATKKTSRI